MALSAIVLVRRSSSSLTPMASRLLGSQRTINPSVLFNPVNQTISNNSSSLASASFFSASPAPNRPTCDKSLIRAIESEIHCSEDNFEEFDDVPERFPFKLKEHPGQQIVYLTREYQGEHISVEIEPHDAKCSSELSLPMVVKVSKAGGPSLEFGIQVRSDEIDINSLSMNRPHIGADQFPYKGPRFDELDGVLQQAFYKYLETRGIKRDATRFLHEYMVKKEHREYTDWLKDVKEFVEA